MKWRVSLVLAIAALAGNVQASPNWKSVEAEASAILAQYIRIDTSNPPGNVSAAVSYLERVLEREGIHTRRYVADGKRGRINLLARLPGSGKSGKKPLLMLAHMDVVPVVPARWLVPPFSGIVKDGELWGRGAIDMKGMGVIDMMAMILLKRAGARLDRDLLLLFNADEEIGGDLGARWMVENHYSDLDPEYVLDEGSAASRGIYTDDGRIVFGVSVAEKKVLWLKITARGDSGHGSMPGRRLAVSNLARVIALIPGLQPAARDTAIVADMRKRLGKLADNTITRALGRTTLTVTSLRAGVGDPPKVNVIPGIAEATVDCRLLPEDSVENMIADIRKLCDDPDITLEVVLMPADIKPQGHDTPLFRAIAKAVSADVPGAITVPVLLAGGTDARFFRALGAVAYGFEPMIRTVEEEELIHGDNERIRLEELYRGIRIYHDLLGSFLSPAAEDSRRP